MTYLELDTKYFDASDISTMFGCNLKTAYTWIKSGRFGESWLFNSGVGRSKLHVDSLKVNELLPECKRR